MRAGIALGSNVGDRLGFLSEGKRRLLKHHEKDAPALVSIIYETEPVDCAPGTPSFLNAVVEIETSLKPLDLLDATQGMESDLGRPTERTKNSPRTLDVDLLYYGDRILDHDRLTLPHPRAIERQFVLAPLSDIRPNMVWPGTARTSSEFLAHLKRIESVPAPKPFSTQW